METPFPDFIRTFQTLFLERSDAPKREISTFMKNIFFPILTDKLIHLCRTYDTNFKPHVLLSMKEQKYTISFEPTDVLGRVAHFTNALALTLPLFIQRHISQPNAAMYCAIQPVMLPIANDANDWIHKMSDRLTQIFGGEYVESLTQWVDEQRELFKSAEVSIQTKNCLRVIYECVMYQWLGPAFLTGRFRCHLHSTSLEHMMFSRRFFTRHRQENHHACDSFQFLFLADQLACVQSYGIVHPDYPSLPVEDLVNIGHVMEVLDVHLPLSVGRIVFGYLLCIDAWLIPNPTFRPQPLPEVSYAMKKKMCRVHTVVYVLQGPESPSSRKRLRSTTQDARPDKKMKKKGRKKKKS